MENSFLVWFQSPTVHVFDIARLPFKKRLKLYYMCVQLKNKTYLSSSHLQISVVITTTITDANRNRTIGQTRSKL